MRRDHKSCDRPIRPLRAGFALSSVALASVALSSVALASLALAVAPASAQSLGPRLEPGAVCRWGGLDGDRVLLCPAVDAEGRRVFRIVERRPAEAAPFSAPYAQSSAGAVASPSEPRASGFSSSGVSPRVGASVNGAVGRNDDGDLSLTPSGRVGVGAGLPGRLRPNVGVGVGLPSGRVSAGVGTRVNLGSGVSLGTGLSVPLGRVF